MLAKLPPIAKRTTQGTPLTSLEHDDIHELLYNGINSIIDVVNGMSGGSGSLPTGLIMPYGGTSLPTSYVWANGQVLSTSTYPNLYAVFGTTFNIGGESPTQFRVPNIIGKTVSGTNPMGGVTEVGYTSRALGAIYGAEKATYTPSGAVSQASVSNITATCGAISTSSITASVSQATATSSAPSVASITATCGAISTASLTSSVVLDNGAINGAGSLGVDGVTCQQFNDNEKTTEAISCATLSIDLAAVAAALTTNVSVQSATIGGSIPSPTITIGGSIPAPTISVSSQTVSIGGSISSPSITIGGSIATQTFSGTASDIATLPPTIALNWIVKT